MLAAVYAGVANRVAWILWRLAKAPLELPASKAPTPPGASAMRPYELPLLFAPVGLALYTVLAGADLVLASDSESATWSRLCHSNVTSPVLMSISCTTPSITIPSRGPPTDERSARTRRVAAPSRAR